MPRFSLHALALVVVLCLAHAQAADVDGTASLQFDITRPVQTTYPFGDRHIAAVWVTDAQNTFIETVRLDAANANRFQWLSQWNAGRGGSTFVDGVSNATPSVYPQSFAVTWNCRYPSGAEVSDGKYRVHIEFTDRHAQGPYTWFEFDKGGVPASSSPTILSSALGSINNLQFTYVPEPAMMSLLAVAGGALLRRRR